MIAAAKSIYDWFMLVHILGDARTISEAKVKVYEKHRRDLKILKDMKNDPRRTDLLRVKIRDTALLAGDEAELEKLQDQIERARGGTVRVTGNVYPGVRVEIDELRVLVKEQQKKLEFVRDQDKILMCAIES